MTCRTFIIAWSLLVAGVLTTARAEEVSVAVAANFTAPMQALAPLFEKESGHKLVLSFGSTGSFYAQIRNGAPFEVLLSADDETPARLVQDKAAVPGSAFAYAFGTLVLWSPRAGLVDGAGEVLRQPGFQRLALANPRLAPYGAAAVQTLKAMGLYETLQPRLVMGENITQTLQFIRSGNAQLGFVALSQVMRDGRIEGSFWRVDERLHEPIRQDAVLLEKGRGKAGAQALLAFLRGDRARAVIESFGYGLQARP